MINLESARQNEALIVIDAKLTFKTTLEGGRSTPIKTGYRPNHCFGRLENISECKFHIGEIQFKDKEFVYPGETSVVTVFFLKAGDIEKYLNVGQRWHIYEVPRLVGEGMILHIH